MYGALPATRQVATPNGGVHVYFQHPGFDIKNRAGIVPGIDVRGDGGYVVLPPSQLANGKQYQYENQDAPIAETPQWLLELLKSKPQPSPVFFQADTALIPNGQRNDCLIRLAGSFRKYGVSDEQVFEWLWQTNLSRCNPPMEEQEVRAIARSASRWQPDQRLFPLTDSGNAELFASLNDAELLFDHRQQRWLLWEQHWWTEDQTGEVYRKAKDAARKRKKQAVSIPDKEQQAEHSSFGIKSENRSKIEACIELAKNEPELCNSGDGWDSDHTLLAVLNGIVDLHTGKLHDGLPSDRISIHSNVMFDPIAKCPRWNQFMDEVFLGDQELIQYVQRAIGYSLTGQTAEHLMFICYGSGANGKSVMLRILAEMLGGYAKVMPYSTLDSNNRSAISNDVASLVGRRLAWLSETEQSSTLNEAKVKQLVHADEVTARFMYREFFTFTPIAKFWLTVNDLPTVRDSSHGFWRSVHVIPFLAQFTDKADPQLTDKLRLELPGILNWAIEGCADYLTNGLCPPETVIHATQNYRADNDVLADFISCCCDLGDDKAESASALYSRYTRWAGHNGIKERDVLSQKQFGSRMGAKFSRARGKMGNTYRGLIMRPEGEISVD
jgi:putative DNA primase/helicase